MNRISKSDIQEMATRNQEEVRNELEDLIELLPFAEDGRMLFIMLFSELHHWLFTTKELGHSKPSELLAELLKEGREAKKIGGIFESKKPLKYDA